MDLAPFSEEKFDSKAWINDNFKNEDKKEQHASSLVMRLQLAIQEENACLEDLSQQVLSSLPRVLRDVESLGQESSLLKTQMATLMADVQKVSRAESSSSSLDTLVRLERLKSRLTQASQALRQADNWTTLAGEVEEVLESGDLEAAADKVLQLQRCLSVLQQARDGEERAALLNSLQLRIEAMASPHLVEAFTRRNLDESVKYCGILRAVGREGQAWGYYQQCEVAGLNRVWGAAQEGDDPSCLSRYYQHLAAMLQQQVEWVRQVFPGMDARLQLCFLAAAALSDLEPPLHQVAGALLKMQEDHLQFLATLRSAMDDFLVQARHTLGRDDPCSPEVAAAGVLVSRALFTPFSRHLTRMEGYERTLLLAHLQRADIPRRDVTETLPLLRDYCATMRSQCEQAAERCSRITGLASYKELVSGVCGYVSGVVAVLAWARKAVAALQRDITHDWTAFTACLDLINTAGVLLLSVEGCDEAVSSAASAATSLYWQQQPFTLSVPLLLEAGQADALRATLDDVAERGSGALEAALSEVQGEVRECVSAALHTISSPLRTHLAPLPRLALWAEHHSTSVLSAVLAPQEYVTQMGQYLLTLLQHLEPLLVTPSPALNRALQQAGLDEAAHCERVVSESEVSAADFLIGRVAAATCALYAEAVLHIPTLQQDAQSQLITDIEYICNILEDLGVRSCRPLDVLLQLLRIAPVDYAATSVGLTAPATMVAAVRQMRNIPATS